ncbi:uncharacterized protein LOC107859368 isoform X2 [Capsicum annuum]|uniref:uncharacterized protein LOC107859368 isoform X2 n=1 Tax=Capsicum annuum TaxID=4072 RepID=UPI001FB0A951|nr:uncharacterized protein LOC107859368 isoform X2 [Capsicum annuum]
MVYIIYFLFLFSFTFAWYTDTYYTSFPYKVFISFCHRLILNSLLSFSRFNSPYTSLSLYLHFFLCNLSGIFVYQDSFFIFSVVLTQIFPFLLLLIKAFLLLIMASLEAQHVLDLVVRDYIYKRGFHWIGDAFSNEIRINQNLVAFNSPHEAFLQAWWEKFYEAYNSRFLGVPIFAVESFPKVAQIVEHVVESNGPDLMEDKISALMTSLDAGYVLPDLSPQRDMTSGLHFPVMSVMEDKISALMTSLDAGYVLPDLSPQRDMTSGLHFPVMSEMDGMLPCASNSGYQMQQMPTVPPEWNARVDIPGANLGGPMLLEPTMHAAANHLPALPELSDAGNNRYLQQASHQGWPSVDVLPNVAVQTLDELGFSASASSSDFFRMLTEADSSVKDAGMLGDANKGALENLPAEQQIIAPMGGIMRSSGKQPAVEEQINQLGVQFLKKRGRKRKTPLSSLAPAGKEKATVAGFSALAHAQAGFAAFAHTQAERKDNFKEVSSLHTNYNKLLCCHINSKGELLATAGHDGKVLIWELENNNVYSGEGHAHHVTDIRFRPNSTLFATSSFDRTVKIWDAAKPSNPFQNLVGHIEHVMSVDFHPRNAGLLSSCDSNDDIILWDVTKGDRKLIFKGGSRQVRFQPRHGDFLASSIGNMINIFDVETNNIQKQLQGHIKDVRSICWDGSGNYLASVSEDSARIWSVSEGKCLHELCSSGNKFQSCTFHPGYAQVLVIGSFEFLELWNPFFQSNITRPYSAHAGIISSLADSPSKGTIASVSHDQWIKIWR